MFTANVNQVQHPIGVLLGGSGRARVLPIRPPQLARLVQPPPSVFWQLSGGSRVVSVPDDRGLQGDPLARDALTDKMWSAEPVFGGDCHAARAA